MIKTFSEKTSGVKTWKKAEELVMWLSGEEWGQMPLNWSQFEFKEGKKGSRDETERTTRVERDKCWEVTDGQFMKGLGNKKNFSFYSEWNRKPLEGLGQGITWADFHLNRI